MEARKALRIIMENIENNLPYVTVEEVADRATDILLAIRAIVPLECRICRLGGDLPHSQCGLLWQQFPLGPTQGQDFDCYPTGIRKDCPLREEMP